MKKILKYIYVIPTLCFLVTIFTMAARNLPYMAEVIGNISLTEIESLTNTFENDLKENLIEKRELIDLNGKMAKVLGMNTLNDRQKLRNGYLSVLGGYVPTEDLVQMVSGMVSVLNEEGINYLYVQAPSKPYFYGTPFAKGYENIGHNALEDLMNALAGSGVKVVHMDDWFEDNQWTMEDVYFATDHHWRPKAAFAAMQHVMEYLEVMDDSVIYDETTLDLNNWNVEVYEDYWLGSDGQRTGKSYAGVDDISYIYPKFETDVTFSYLDFENQMNYRDSVYFPEFLEEPDYKDGNNYYVYFGENHPLAYIKNPMAVNDQKVIVVGDSYRLPFESFLTTQFTEIYHVDLRFYTSSTFVEFVKQINPDHVLMIYTGPSYAGGDGQYNFGVEEWKAAFEGKEPSKELFTAKEIVVSAEEEPNYYHLVTANLKAGAYEMTFDNVTADTEHLENYVQASVINLKTNEVIKSRYLHANGEEEQKWVFSLPQAEDSNYAVVFYAGVENQTKGVTASVSGVTLTQYEMIEETEGRE